LKLAREYVFDVAVIPFLVVQIPDRAELLVGQVRVVFDLLIPGTNMCTNTYGGGEEEW
jgi:hypothetical protein